METDNNNLKHEKTTAISDQISFLEKVRSTMKEGDSFTIQLTGVALRDFVPNLYGYPVEPG